jgi:hypothetical protein
MLILLDRIEQLRLLLPVVNDCVTMIGTVHGGLRRQWSIAASRNYSHQTLETRKHCNRGRNGFCHGYAPGTGLMAWAAAGCGMLVRGRSPKATTVEAG